MNLNRRGFIIGLTSLIVAPAIVKPFNIMPVSVIDIWNTRYIWDYHIGTDSMILRVDRALHILPIPKHIQTIPEYIAHKFIDKKKILTLQPKEHEQFRIDVYVSGRELKEAGFKYPNNFVS